VTGEIRRTAGSLSREILFALPLAALVLSFGDVFELEFEGLAGFAELVIASTVVVGGARLLASLTLKAASLTKLLRGRSSLVVEQEQ
jgi:hypothetical protein